MQSFRISSIETLEQNTKVQTQTVTSSSTLSKFFVCQNSELRVTTFSGSGMALDDPAPARDGKLFQQLNSQIRNNRLVGRGPRRDYRLGSSTLFKMSILVNHKISLSAPLTLNKHSNFIICKYQLLFKCYFMYFIL